MSDFKEDYDKLVAKYNLPKFEEIEATFELDTLDESHFPLRDLRLKIHDKLHEICNILGELIHSEASIAVLYESGHITDEVKIQIFTLHKKARMYLRTAQKLSFENDEQKDADFINNFYSSWPSIKKEIIFILELLSDYWANGKETKESLAYFG